MYATNKYTRYRVGGPLRLQGTLLLTRAGMWVLGHSAESFAEFAASVFRPRPPEVVEVGHVHKVGVSVPEQAVRILDMFRLVGPDRWLGFEALTRDCGVSLEVVGRFLALLELYKAQVVVFEQVESLGELKVAWTGVDVDPMVVLAGRWE